MKYLLGFFLLFVVIAVLPASNDTFALESDKIENSIFVPNLIRVGPDGNVYISDRKDQALKVYSGETGKFIRKISGLAEGPGYYKGLADLGFSDNKTIFFVEPNYGHPWITYLDISGKLIKTVKTERKSRYGFENAKILPDKRIIAMHYTYSPFPPYRKGKLWLENYWRSLVIINHEGNFVKSILEISQPFRLSETPTSATAVPPFFPDYIWDITRDNRIVFTQGNSNILKIYDLQGKQVGTIKTPLPEAPKVTAKDLQDWRDTKKQEYIDKNDLALYQQIIAPIINQYTEIIYDRKQIIESLSVTPMNNVLICGFKPKTSTLYQHYLINMKGGVHARITSRAQSIVVTEKLIVYIIEDEDENATVYCMKRKGSEKDDLLKLNGK